MSKNQSHIVCGRRKQNIQSLAGLGALAVTYFRGALMMIVSLLELTGTWIQIQSSIQPNLAV
jgi:hypothetical protein